MTHTKPPAAEAAPRAVPFLAGGPEALLHVADVGGHPGNATGTMRTGPWNVAADGAPAFGALGVLTDVVWGGAAVACAPPGQWGITIEMEASFGAPPPADGSRLHAHGEAVHRDAQGALATGTVRAADGTLIAAGSQRTRFRSAAPQQRPLDPDAVAPLAGRGIADLLGLAPDGTGELAFIPALRVANTAGIAHGGILFCASELAASRALGAAAAGLAPSSLKIVYLRPGAIGEELRCLAEIIYRGRTTATVHVRCVRPDGKACTVATLSYGPVLASNPSRRGRLHCGTDAPTLAP